MDTFTLKLVLVIILTATNYTQQQDVESPLVETSLGKIEGSILKSQYGATIYAFRGIHYAKPPVDDLRFAPPEPVEPWNDTLKASSDSLVCPQPGLTIFMTENCLTLNVFTRNLTSNSPVMVYIHGGANVLGSGNSQYEAGPQYLLDHDVVLVAFNYRLGALGFLSTRTKEAPGNNGFLDQVLALKWVQTHIANFGGDPSLVTIFGMSAGAMAVTLHLASPLSKGLFHRAIAMSGSATNHFSIDNVYWTRKLARELSCPMYNTKDIIDCLRSISWKTIVAVCAEWEPYGFINMKWNYEIDGHFLTSHPIEVFRNNSFNRVPLLAGFTKNELDYSVYHLEQNTGLLNDINVNFNLYAPEMFLYDGKADQTKPSQSERIKEFYLKNDIIASDKLEELGVIFSDAIIGHGVHRLVQLASNTTDVFYYRMDYIGRRSSYNKDGAIIGVGHADDLQYVMPGLWYGPQFALDDPDMFMVNRITKWWTSFANYGAPYPEYQGQWEPVTRGDIITLYNDKETSIGKAPFTERYELWDDMFPIVKSNAIRLQFGTLFVILLSGTMILVY